MAEPDRELQTLEEEFPRSTLALQNRISSTTCQRILELARQQAWQLETLYQLRQKLPSSSSSAGGRPDTPPGAADELRLLKGADAQAWQERIANLAREGNEDLALYLLAIFKERYPEG